MNVAKSVLGALFVLPVAELTAFILVATVIGFGRALLLVLASSFGGILVLRHAGGAHIERVRVALGTGSITSLNADGSGALSLLAGFLLLVPGFITSAIGLVLLVPPLRHLAGWLFGIKPAASTGRADGVVDLDPEQWRRVPDPSLPDRRDDAPDEPPR